MTEPIRTAVLGFGLAGSVFHAPAIAADPRLSLDYIVTSDAGRQAKARAAHPDAVVLDSAAQLWERGVDLVVVATPPATHVTLAEAALDAGAAVVVDKPFTVTSAEGEALIAKAEAAGLLITTYQNRRWDGEYLTLKKLMAAGSLGEVRRFESRLERWSPQIAKAWKAAAGPAEGGGILYDLGTHLIDQALQLFGPVRRVYGELDARRPQEKVDDDVFVALEHENGVRSHLWMNLSTPQLGPRLRVLGSEAAYTKRVPDQQEAQILAGILPGHADYGVDPEANWGLLGRDGALVPVPTERGNFADFYTQLAASLLDGGPVPVDPADSVAALRIIEEVRAQQG
ncbi:Gfo/Idh/MocA family protein [Arthrobacter sp. 35W]|uniref:Gfo/Idh/MocA family protein n=1 Tax=Arthrobacter sp. 35W TaxID=1132441 RepID=UPI00054FB713|nr:Gfo/Idh/MocA family oxidoreductase [Arthrobacter sp. 35W]